MIRIDRSTVPSPLNPELVARTKARLAEWYRQPSEVRLKQKLDPRERVTINREARIALGQLFHNKCAYCESQLDVSTPGEIDRFRPFTDASDLSGEGSPDHYGWLAADWENLYLACPSCSRSKRSLFPVDGARAELLTPMEDVRSAERALLVDPCLDDPSNHFQFNDTGYVQALTIQGEVSIKVWNLNREGLVRARLDVWRLTAAQTIVSEPGDYQHLTAPDRPYCAVVRAAVVATLAAQSASEPQPIGESRLSVPRERRSAEEILALDEEAFRLTARPLRRVEITNFRALRNAVLQFAEPGSERAPWLILLGENATGKSSVLQAIALALAGADEARRVD